jgi:hypothetical protein
MNAIDCREELQESSDGTVQTLVSYRLSFFTAVFPQLKLWRLPWVVPAQSMGKDAAGVLLPVSRRLRSNCWSLSRYSSCVFHAHSITTDPCCVVCALRALLTMALRIVVTNNTAEKYIISSDGHVCLEN